MKLSKRFDHRCQTHYLGLEEEEEIYLCNTQHTVYRHAYNMCNIRIAIKY